MFDKIIIRNNVIALIIIGLPASLIGLPWIGIVAFFAGIINLLLGLMVLLMQRKKQTLTFLVCSGVLLLIGFSICSSSTISVH